MVGTKHLELEWMFGSVHCGSERAKMSACFGLT